MLQILSGLRDPSLSNELYHVVLQNGIQPHPSTVLTVIKLQGLILPNAFIITVREEKSSYNPPLSLFFTNNVFPVEVNHGMLSDTAHKIQTTLKLKNNVQLIKCSQDCVLLSF